MSAVLLALGLKLFGGMLVAVALGFLTKELHKLLSNLAAKAHTSAAQDVIYFLEQVTDTVLSAAPATVTTALNGRYNDPAAYEAALAALGKQALAQVEAAAPGTADKLEADLPALIEALLAGKAQAQSSPPSSPPPPPAATPASAAK